MISNVQSSLRTTAQFAESDGATVLGVVNRQVYASSLGDRSATLFYAVFDGATRTLRYVNAGHNPPLVIRENGSITLLGTGGAPLGMFPDWSYQECAVDLHPGDVLLCYTDGVVEAANPAGEEWGVEGLLKAATASDVQCPEEILQSIFTSMDDFSLGRQTDDATVVVLRVN
jgi:sigma-B regulation protein RsbU (phosphoserine phosphatase)